MSLLDQIIGKTKEDNGLIKTIEKKINHSSDMKDLFNLVQEENYVGEVIEMHYKNATIQVSDYDRQKVKGIPSQSFLIATRLLSKDINISTFEDEDSCVLLLRVLDSAQLPMDVERKRIRSEIAEDANSKEHWESDLDFASKRVMSFSGLTCRIIGTFYLKNNGKILRNKEQALELSFGSDISNFYPNRGLKVYKPTRDSLKTIINFGLNESSIEIGQVRYASTQRPNDEIDSVKVKLNPEDLVSQKTAIFGMTRTGKSNTVKTIMKAIYQNRFAYDKPQTIGQIVFDPNGEYANENIQDKDDTTGQAQALRNVWKISKNGKIGHESDVSIYSLSDYKADQNRKILKINFYDDDMLEIGKNLINTAIEQDAAIANSNYIRSFINLRLLDESDEEGSYSQGTREKRCILIYKTILYKSGFSIREKDRTVQYSGLFSGDLINHLKEGIDGYYNLEDDKRNKFKEKKRKYDECADTLEKLSKIGCSYDDLFEAFKFLAEYIKDVDSTFHQFNRYYKDNKSSTGSNWNDNKIDTLLNLFTYDNTPRHFAKALKFHNHKSSGDYALSIYKDLEAGRLVIIDQALGDSKLNKMAAERIVFKIFNENAKKFAQALEPSNIIIFLEEAHNLLPKGSEEDTTNIWARVAKEGAKFKIGMVYSTQEVSSIQRNILKNTTNWFISHLNSREEIHALEDYYDFEDFSSSILTAEDKGFIRMKTRSNKFVVPIQVDKFQVKQ